MDTLTGVEVDLLAGVPSAGGEAALLFWSKDALGTRGGGVGRGVAVTGDEGILLVGDSFTGGMLMTGTLRGGGVHGGAGGMTCSTRTGMTDLRRGEEREKERG